MGRTVTQVRIGHLRQVVPEALQYSWEVVSSTIELKNARGPGVVEITVVNTSTGFGGECHLDAVMLQSGPGRLDLNGIDLLIIENVANPAVERDPRSS